MALLSDIIGRGTTAAKPAATDLPVGSIYYDTTLGKWVRTTGAAWEDCEPAAAGSGVTWADLQSMQLVNEVKGWPPVVAPDADLVTLNLWWDDVATPSTKATVVDVAGEGGITETYELCLKCVADGSGDGLMQRYTYADEPRVKLGRALSAVLAIWSVGAIDVTAKLVNSDASETAASATAAAAWTIVTIENHTLAGTYCDLQVTAGAAGTFYVVPLGVCIGANAVPLGPRPSRYVDVAATNVVNGVDPGGAVWADLDYTATTSPLCHTVHVATAYKNTTNVNKTVVARRNGSADTGGYILAESQVTASCYYRSLIPIPVDDGQIMEWQSNAAAGDSETLYIGLNGYWEWA